MLKSRRIRFLLVLILLSVILAIIWSILSRDPGSLPFNMGRLLGPDISRQTTRFEYLQRKEGRVIFRIQASTSIMTRSGTNTLEQVRLIRYDPSGEAADSISGEQAVYQPAEKKITFSGDVEMTLSDGTRVFSSEVGADLETEVIRIDREFRFEHHQTEGRGSALRYFIPDKRIEIDRRLELSSEDGSGRIVMGADEVSYWLDPGRIELAGNGRISDAAHSLSAQKITIVLTEQRELFRILSAGNSRLGAGPGRIFSGQRINFIFHPEGGTLHYFEILPAEPGAPNTSSVEPVRYEERTAEGRLDLQGQEMRAFPRAAQAGNREPVLERLTVQGMVRLQSTPLQIEEARTDLLTATFYEAGGGPRVIEMKGGVSVDRTVSEGALPAREHLTGDQLRIELTPGGELDRSQASGSVQIELNSEQGSRHLFARDVVVLDYAEGQLVHAVSRGGCVLESIEGSRRNVLRTPDLDATYEAGMLRRVAARGGVDLETSDSGLVRRTQSERLEVLYEQGRMVRAEQQENFHLWERSDRATIDITSDLGTYDPPEGSLTFSGEQAVVLRYAGSGPGDGERNRTETTASRMVLQEKSGVLEALGQVRSVLHQNQGAVVVTAGEMMTDPQGGWVQYSGNPQVLQGPNLIMGKSVRFEENGERIRVRDEVESQLVQSRNGGSRRFTVTADRLDYEGSRRLATYEGSVQVKSAELLVEAPFVEIFFAAEGMSEVERIVGSRGVQITEKGRRASGERAVYYPADDRVVVSAAEAP